MERTNASADTIATLKSELIAAKRGLVENVVKAKNSEGHDLVISTASDLENIIASDTTATAGGNAQGVHRDAEKTIRADGDGDSVGDGDGQTRGPVPSLSVAKGTKKRPVSSVESTAKPGKKQKRVRIDTTAN